METGSPYTSPIPPQGTNPSFPRRFNRLLYVAVVIGGLAALVSAYLLWGERFGIDFSLKSLLETKNAEPAFVFRDSANSITDINAYGSTSPRILTESGNDYFVIDTIELQEDNRMFHLLAKRGDLFPQLYSRTEKGKLTQVTFSSTVKYGLSYDTLSKTLVYQSASSTFATWKTTIFSFRDAKEKDIHPGTQSQISKGGAHILIRDLKDILSVDTDSLATRTILTLKNPQTPIAFSHTGSSFSVYNATTAAIDYYVIGNSGAASYSNSSPPFSVPVILLSYDNNDALNAVLSSASPGSFGFKVSNTSSGIEKVFRGFPSNFLPKRVIWPSL